MINDLKSYVASTYQKNDDTVESIFYNEEKLKIYLTKKVGDLIIPAHYYCPSLGLKNVRKAMNTKY